MNPRIIFDKNIIQSKKFILGIDEVGWGCVAGPVVLGGCLINRSFYEDIDINLEKYPFFEEIKDSKKVSELKRNLLYQKLLEYHLQKTEFKLFKGEAATEFINQHKLALAYSKSIDEIILEVKKNVNFDDVLVLIDGNRDPKSSLLKEYSLIVKGDDKSFAIACASLYAKEYRDSYMRELDKTLPEYNFSKHKGYGTKDHTECLLKNGLSIEHRIEASKKLIEN